MNAPFDLNKAMAMDGESSAAPLVIANVSRRKFLQGAAGLSGLVLVVAFVVFAHPGFVASFDGAPYLKLGQKYDVRILRERYLKRV